MLRLTAATMPAGRPMTSANSIATSESSTVAGKRAANSENTGSCVIDRDAEVAVQGACHTYSPYCTGSGRSRPNSCTSRW